jgi:hypothetical protein
LTVINLIIVQDSDFAKCPYLLDRCKRQDFYLINKGGNIRNNQVKRDDYESMSGEQDEANLGMKGHERNM